MMKRAQPHQVRTGFLQLDMAGNNFNDIGTRKHFIEEGWWKVSHKCLCSDQIADLQGQRPAPGRLTTGE